MYGAALAEAARGLLDARPGGSGHSSFYRYDDYVREKEAGGCMQSTKLDDGFFDLGGGLGGGGGGSPSSKMPPRLKKQPSSGTSMRSTKLDDAFFAGSSTRLTAQGGSCSSLGERSGPPMI